MSKCNMCLDRLKQGLKPICVLSCSMRALEFGPLDDLVEQYGNLRKLEDMPKGTITKPAAVFKPADARKQVVPWDPGKALELWQKSSTEGGRPLADLFQAMEDVTEAPTGIVGRRRPRAAMNSCTTRRTMNRGPFWSNL